ncbi:MAG: GtrA family protein [Opitutales bacterium]
MRKLLGKIHRSESHRATFARFATVGVSISAIDALVLYALLGLGVNPYLGRAVSLAAAMAAGYVLNRYFTFHHLETGRALWHSLLRHYSVHAVGAGINIAVYSLVLQVGLEMGREIAASATLPLLGVWIGGMAGLGFNYILSKKLVFDN